MTISYEGISITDAVRVQQQLRSELDIAERELHLTTIAGADISLNLHSTTVYAGIILLSFPQLKPLAYSLIKAETHVPYVPGFLAFREVPALAKAWEQMERKPDMLVVDGHGIAHPRRMGIAAHFGTLTGQPSIGCAKKLLAGTFAPPAMEQGSSAAITDHGETIGYAYRSKRGVLPVFVSPGHKAGLQNSLDIISRCAGKYRIPEPTRLAHELVNAFRKGEVKEGYHLIGEPLQGTLL
jgi:deoxyribonuclease V